MPRHIVSYFGNRYLDHFERDLEEIADQGFNTVVHCVTEADLAWSMERVSEMFAMTRDAGMECWADPWGLARIFGGEAHSGFLASGKRACMSGDELDVLLTRWVDAVVAAGADTVFWDEPNLEQCGCCTDRVVEFLDRWTSYAASRQSIDGERIRNSVCMCSWDRNEPLMGKIAALPAVDDIGTDPYYTMPLEDYDPGSYVGRWADIVRQAADENGIDSHLWVQGFGLAAGCEHVFADAADTARVRGVTNIAFWGFRAAEATSTIAPERKELVWQMARDVFRVDAGSVAADSAAALRRT